MIAKQINRRKNSVSNFPRLFKYLTTELDPDTGARRKRCTNRDIVWSESNLCFLDTAAYEMQGTAFMNVRCKDALYYYILSWPQGEVPFRTQWHDAIHHTLASLGFAEHQYVAVALKKGEHFSVHIMVNRVHPETLKAHTPSWSYCALSIASRELEAKYGWQPTRGIFRWDDLTQTVVRIPPHLRSSYSDKEPLQIPTDTALDRCSTRATLLAYAPLLKPISARYGDTVTVSNAGISIKPPQHSFSAHATPSQDVALRRGYVCFGNLSTTERIGLSYLKIKVPNVRYLYSML